MRALARERFIINGRRGLLMILSPPIGTMFLKRINTGLIFRGAARILVFARDPESKVLHTGEYYGMHDRQLDRIQTM